MNFKNNKFIKKVAITALALTIGTPLASSITLALGTVEAVHAKTKSTPVNQFNQNLWVQKTLNELNRLRAQNGLRPVVADPTLMTFTQGRANTIYKKQKLDHTGNYGDTKKPMGTTGENLAQSIFTGGPNTDSKNIIAQLYDDEGVPTFGHRKNMLAPFYNKVGIGITYDAKKNYLWVAMTFFQDPSIKGDRDDITTIMKYLNYCNRKGIDNVNWPTKYDMAGKEYFTAKYNANGMSQDNVVDSKFGPNTIIPVKGIVTIVYPKGYGINLWKTPSSKGGFYAGRKLMSGTKWKVNGKQGGFYRVGKNQWIEAVHTSFKSSK